MTEPVGRVIEGMKFMWDGKDYQSVEEVKRVQADYEKEKFETRIVEEDGKIHLYTRRVVTEVMVEGTPPA